MPWDGTEPGEQGLIPGEKQMVIGYEVKQWRGQRLEFKFNHSMGHTTLTAQVTSLMMGFEVKKIKMGASL